MALIKKISCILCKSEISGSNFNKHYGSKQCLSGGKAQLRYATDEEKVRRICKFCGTTWKSFPSLISHECFCKSAPDELRHEHPRGMLGKKGWNNGLTKDTSYAVKQNGIAIKRTISKNGHKGFCKGSKHTEATKDKLSELACTRLQKNSKYSKNILYKNVILESTYEVVCAEILDELDITWEKVRAGFKWDDNGKIRRYIPDFYLPEFGIYLDPKNDYLINKDKRKIQSACEINNIIVVVLSQSQLTKDYMLGVTRGEWDDL